MIAVYFVEESGPFHSMLVAVEAATQEALDKAIEKEQAPRPSHDVLFIENDQVVNTIQYVIDGGHCISCGEDNVKRRNGRCNNVPSSSHEWRDR